MTEQFDPNKKPKLDLPPLGKIGEPKTPQLPKLPSLQTPNTQATPPTFPGKAAQPPAIGRPTPVTPPPAPPVVPVQRTAPVTPPAPSQPQTPYQEPYRGTQQYSEQTREEHRYNDPEPTYNDNRNTDSDNRYREERRYNDPEPRNSQYYGENNSRDTYQNRDDRYREEEQQNRYNEEYPQHDDEPEKFDERDNSRKSKNDSRRKNSKADNKAKKPPVQSRKGAKTKEKVQKPNQYAGSRKKVLYSRIAVFGIIGVLALSGLWSYIPKASNLTASDNAQIISNVRADLGMTYFPNEAGEGWSRGFIQAYLNYNPEIADVRKELLNTYASEDFIESIDIKGLSEGNMQSLTKIEKPTEADLLNIAGITNTSQQAITQGPFLMKTEMLPGNTTAVYSYRVQINGNNWAYIEVPVFYDSENRAMSISGTPTFRSIIPIADVPKAAFNPAFTNDLAVNKLVKTDITNYFKAWAASDQETIDRYLIKENGKNVATPQASTGLGGSMKFLGMDELTVQEKKLPVDEEITADMRADFNKRYALAKVQFVEPTSGLVYTQNFQLILEFTNDNWFIKDIRNVSIFADQTVIKQQMDQKAEQKKN